MSGAQAREQDKENEVRSTALLLNSTRTRVPHGVGREHRERGWIGAQRLTDPLRAALICSALTLSAVCPCWGQEGYSLQSGRVVVDSKEHWERWHSAANTVQISDEGVKPAFIRKHTRLEIDGEEVVVPGINAALNAVDFGGGVLNAGSNRSSGIDLMDGRMDTFWEPDPSDLLQDWWVQIDLGRTVSATKIVLKFVGEDLGDPFLQFKVITSQGQKTLGQLLFRTRFTTDKPIKNERVFEIDLTKQLPTKWPDALGDFTGDVIQYVGVGITDSDFGRARQVSQSEYDGLPADQQGEIDHFRREVSGEVRLLDGREDWEALAGTERQGPVIYYRREMPRLAEIEVWTIGDNIGTGVLERGGRVSARENINKGATVVDGDLFGEVVFWSANGSYDPNKLPIADPRDAERSMFIDLGGSYFVDNIRILHALPNPPPFRAYRIQLSDGSTNAGGELAWKTVGSLSDIVRGQNFHDFKFPLTKVEHFAFTYRLHDRSTYEPGQGSHGVSEVQFFGEGFLPEAQISSEFGGEAPFIEVARTPRNLASIEWEADVPPGANIILQTRTGDTVESITRYYKKNGDLYPGTEEEAANAYETDKKFFGDASVGPVITETRPGNDWSGWSQPYFDSGAKITSPSPRRFAAIRAIFLTEDPKAAATLRSVALNFVTPVAGAIVGEILPSRLEEIGAKQQLSYFIRSTFKASSRGFDEILIEAPDGVDMTLKQVNVAVTGQDAVTYSAESEGFEVVMETDSLWVRLPAAIKTTSGSALVELQFEATIFGYNTFFIGSTGHSAFANSWQRVDDGDANGVVDSETTVVLALERGELLGDLQVDRVFTPNGDGVNDELEVRFSLLRVLSSAPVQVDVYDLAGRPVARIAETTLTAGRHTVTWTGVDPSGAVVPPGIYLMRIDLKVDSTSEKKTSVHRLVRVAY